MEQWCGKQLLWKVCALPTSKCLRHCIGIIQQPLALCVYVVVCTQTHYDYGSHTQSARTSWCWLSGIINWIRRLLVTDCPTVRDCLKCNTVSQRWSATDKLTVVTAQNTNPVSSTHCEFIDPCASHSLGQYSYMYCIQVHACIAACLHEHVFKQSTCHNRTLTQTFRVPYPYYASGHHSNTKMSV